MDKQLIGKLIGIVFGVVVILSSIFNWKFIYLINYSVDAWIKLFGLTFYRVVCIVLGFVWIMWMLTF